MLSPQLVIIMSLLSQNVSIPKGHLQASHIKYIKGSTYNCIKFGTEISILQNVKFLSSVLPRNMTINIRRSAKPCLSEERSPS